MDKRKVFESAIVHVQVLPSKIELVGVNNRKDNDAVY